MEAFSHYYIHIPDCNDRPIQNLPWRPLVYGYFRRFFLGLNLLISPYLFLPEKEKYIINHGLPYLMRILILMFMARIKAKNFNQWANYNENT